LPNVLDIDPVRALARRAGARIIDETIAKRYEKLAIDRVLKDPRNFRPIRESELASAPRWAREAHARGEIVSVYKPNRGVCARLHTVGRRLADACTVAFTEPNTQPDDHAAIEAARKFLAKFTRTDFETAARKALDFSRLLAGWEGNLDAKDVCPAQTIVLLRGRVWRRITSVVELRKVGREFHNCLARTTRTGSYGGMLASGRAQFWVLRDLEGKGLIVAMAPAPQATQFSEVKGPGNAYVRADNPDLVELGIAIGVKPPPPPPPPGPPSGLRRADIPGGLMDLLAQLQRPCRCNLCVPRSQPRPRLRQRTSTP
jgi:hypothetical protein